MSEELFGAARFIGFGRGKEAEAERTGEVDIHEFFRGCVRLKGQAKGKDMIQVTVLLSNLHNRTKGFMHHCERIRKRRVRIQDAVEQLRTSLERRR